MVRTLRGIAGAALLSVLTSSALHAQTLRVSVSDSISGQPIPGVRISIVGAPEAGIVLTNAEGTAQFRDVPEGSHSLDASRFGYQSRAVQVVVSGDGVTAQELSLMPDAVAVDSIRVEVEATDPYLRNVGFYERSASNAGYYYDVERLDRIAGGVRLSSKLRYLSRVRVDRFGSITLGRGCRPVIYLDGARVRGFDVDDVVSPRDLVGIEIYDSPNLIPVRFRYATSCGAILIWTRR
jgi:hypothetical protein